MPDPNAAWLDHFEPTPEENQLYVDAAARLGLDVAHWARQVLNQTARELLSSAPAGV